MSNPDLLAVRKAIMRTDMLGANIRRAAQEVAHDLERSGEPDRQILDAGHQLISSFEAFAAAVAIKSRRRLEARLDND